MEKKNKNSRFWGLITDEVEWLNIWAILLDTYKKGLGLNSLFDILCVFLNDLVLL